MEFFKWIITNSPEKKISKELPENKFMLNFMGLEKYVPETNTSRLIEYLTDNPQNWTVTRGYVNESRKQKKYCLYKY